jgi:hypothetical protein
MKKLLIAGGLCGTTMLRAGELITESCRAKGVDIQVNIQNLWETTYVAGNYDVIIEMFPFFENEKCPVVSGKPFINHIGEKDVIKNVTELLCGEVLP